MRVFVVHDAQTNLNLGDENARCRATSRLDGECLCLDVSTLHLVPTNHTEDSLSGSTNKQKDSHKHTHTQSHAHHQSHTYVPALEVVCLRIIWVEVHGA